MTIFRFSEKLASGVARVTLSMKDCDWDAPETVSVVSETFDFLLGDP